MAKNIVFCADGTWNGPGKVTTDHLADDQDDAGELGPNTTTNVYKLFCNLDGRLAPGNDPLSKEQEKVLQDSAGKVLQVAKYIHGVGNTSRDLQKAFEGAFGAGIISRIVRGYTFISRHYEPGDAIYIIGFSRGAYTARALAGMICRVGLLDTTKYDVNNKELAYERGRAAWNLSKSVAITGSNAVIRAVNRGINWVSRQFGSKVLKSDDLIAPVTIKAVGVWDTVGSLGIPLYLASGRTDLFRFTDRILSDQVEYGFHAMAIDELRKDFPVTSWEPRSNIRQVWFVGAHADVGGGYPLEESRLSDVAFDWMMKQLGQVGMQWSPKLMCSPLCDIHVVLASPIHEPWNKPPFNWLGKLAEQPRSPTKDDVFHCTVKERYASGSYRPDALKWASAEAWVQLRIEE